MLGPLLGEPHRVAGAVDAMTSQRGISDDPEFRDGLERRMAELEDDPDGRADAVGRAMGTIDALEAIRDGRPWRGKSAPSVIAREALRVFEA